MRDGGQTGELVEIRRMRQGFVFLHRYYDKLKLRFLKCFPPVQPTPGRKELMQHHCPPAMQHFFDLY